MNFWSAAILLLAISIYDMYAVWHSKHMVTMAEFQTKTQTFAGVFIPYNVKSEKKPIKGAIKIKLDHKTELVPKNAVLGGGDIAFPLLFSAVVMKSTGFLIATIIPVFATIALGCLLYFAKKDRFYPAMPFISLGCAVGYAVILVI